jgi:hypothetical protein
MLSGGALAHAAAAWKTDLTWGTSAVLGAASDGEDDNIVWGSECGGADCTHLVWGAACEDSECDNIVWGTATEQDNIVWGTSSDTEDDDIVWGTADAAEDVLWGAPAIRRPSRVIAILETSLS